MNNNIRKTEEGFEVDHTDIGNETYADEQEKKLVKLSEVQEGQKFRVPNSSRDVVWTRTAEDEQYMGGVAHGNVRWHIRVCADTIVQLVEEPKKETVAQAMIRKVAEMKRDGAMPEPSNPVQLPVSDALVNSIVSEESVKGDLLQEQIQKIRERNVEPLADMLIDDLMEKVPADEAIQHDISMKPVQDVYSNLEEIQNDIEDVANMSSPDALSLDIVIWKLQRTISAGKYIQDGTI